MWTGAWRCWAGPLIDVYGAKLVLLLSYGSSAASYALTGMSHSMRMIYISRMPTLLQVRSTSRLTSPASTANGSPPHPRPRPPPAPALHPPCKPTPCALHGALSFLSRFMRSDLLATSPPCNTNPRFPSCCQLSARFPCLAAWRCVSSQQQPAERSTVLAAARGAGHPSRSNGPLVRGRPRTADRLHRRGIWYHTFCKPTPSLLASAPAFSEHPPAAPSSR